MLFFLGRRRALLFGTLPVGAAVRAVFPFFFFRCAAVRTNLEKSCAAVRTESEFFPDLGVAARTCRNVFGFGESRLFVVPFGEGGSRADEQIEGKSENRRKQDYEQYRKGLHEHVSGAVGNVAHGPNHRSEPYGDEIRSRDAHGHVERRVGSKERFEVFVGGRKHGAEIGKGF